MDVKCTSMILKHTFENPFTLLIEWFTCVSLLHLIGTYRLNCQCQIDFFAKQERNLKTSRCRSNPAFILRYGMLYFLSLVVEEYLVLVYI